MQLLLFYVLVFTNLPFCLKVVRGTFFPDRFYSLCLCLSLLFDAMRSLFAFLPSFTKHDPDVGLNLQVYGKMKDLYLLLSGTPILNNLIILLEDKSH